MNNREQIEEIELSMDQAKESISNMTSLLNLTKNEDFKRIIEQGYFEKEASRLVLLRASPQTQDEETQKSIDNAITAIGHFRQYLMTIMQIGRTAERALEQDEATHAELLQEAL